MTRPIRILVVCFAIVCVAGLVFAHRRGRFGGGRGGGWNRDPSEMDPEDRHGVPKWDVDSNFRSDVFTFVRVQYGSAYGRSNSWLTDFPDSDLNFTFRLQQLTSLKVDPNWKILELTDDALFDYPFIYMLEVGGLTFTEEEVVALRRYLTNGGFLMIDDFWGDWAWDNIQRELERVFPNKPPQPLRMDHPIFH